MLNLKFFWPFERAGIKDRLDRKLARKYAGHDREARRLMQQIEFLAGQMMEHRIARDAITQARAELRLDPRLLGNEIAAGMATDIDAGELPAIPDKPVTMTEVLRSAEARAAEAALT